MAGSNGYLRGRPLPLGHDGESAVVLNDCLDVLNDMLFDDAELAWVLSDPLVLGCCGSSTANHDP